MSFLVFELICVVLQFLSFLPFYLIWRKDCKEIGKENLAVSLSERFFIWIIYCPIWVLPIIKILK
jgi:hypothetical protein